MSDTLLDELPALADPADYPMYQTGSYAEIMKEVGDLVGKDRNLVAIVFNDGVEAIKTRVIALADNADVVLGMGDIESKNQEVLAASDPVCIAQGNRNIQFRLLGLTRIDYQGKPAFRAQLPKEILSMPRRDFFRVVLPIVKPLKCQMPVGEGGNAGLVTVDVVDISGGGLSFNIPPGREFVNGQNYPGCIIDLTGIGKITVTLHICNQFVVTRRSIGKQRRAGCRYAHLSNQVLGQIERFVMNVEREKKARETGLAVGTRSSADPWADSGRRKADLSWDKTRR